MLMTENNKKVILVRAKNLKRIMYIQFIIVFHDGLN